MLVSTIVLGSFAIAGTTKDRAPVDQIYLFKINLTDLNVDNAIEESTGVDLSSVVSVDDVLQELGVSEIYSFGLWGYCQGDNDNGDYSVNNCSSPEPLYSIDPLAVLNSNLEGYSFLLPTKVQDYISTLQTAVKVVFITSIAGVSLAALALIFTVFSFGSKILSFVSTLVGLLSLVSLLIAAAASLGTSLIVTNYFEDNVGDYGIHANLGNNIFQGLIWGAAGAALIGTFFNLFAICCGRTRKNKSKSEEEAPMMVYQERKYGNYESQ
jgi:hypothetical protein